MARQPPQQYGSQEPIGQQSSFSASTGQQGMSGQPQPGGFAQPEPQPGGQGQQFGGQSQPGSQPHYGQMEQGVGGQSMGQPQQFGAGGQAGGMAQQPGAQQQGGRNITLEEGISDEMRVALHDFVQAGNVCEWCAEQCIDEGPQMAECLRLCRDVADLASLNVQFLTRDSVFGPEIAEVFATAAEACAQECAQHAHKHCQECAEVLTRAARSTRKMLASFEGGQAAGGQIGGQF